MAAMFRSPIRFSCPSCGKKLQAAAESVGLESGCPNCETLIVVPTAGVSRAQGLAANGLALVGILALVSVTAEGIERAQKERAIQALESPGAGSADAPAAAAAGEPDLPGSEHTGSATSDTLLSTPSPEPARQTQQQNAIPEAGPEHDPTATDGARADRQAAEKPAVDSGTTSSDPFASNSDRPAPATVPADLEAAKSELEKITAEIESERQRWKDALGVINGLTANKTRPVREGSPAYHRCLEASKVIQEVAIGAPALKARKAQLEERVKALEK